MVFQIAHSIVEALGIYLYPSYATFKVLARREGTDSQDVEKWLTYWCVVGAFVAVETGFEWIIYWFPFYSEIKTLLLLFLTQGGAGIVYKALLEPQYTHYEPQIDAHLAQLRTRTTAYAQEQLQKLYKIVLGAAGVAQNDPTPPTPPATGAAGVAQDLWNTYGQGALAAGAKFMQAQPHAGTPQPPSPAASQTSYASGVDPHARGFPMPYATPRVPSGSSAASGYNIPLPPSDVNLPLGTPSPSPR